jgi:hypothetical protein
LRLCLCGGREIAGKVIESIQKPFTKERSHGARIDHRWIAGEDGNACRLHVRAEERGPSILSINAPKTLHLNPTITELTRLTPVGKPLY